MGEIAAEQDRIGRTARPSEHTGPPFSTEGAGGIPPVRWPRWAKSRNLYYFWLYNRGKREDVEQAR